MNHSKSMTSFLFVLGFSIFYFSSGWLYTSGLARTVTPFGSTGRPHCYFCSAWVLQGWVAEISGASNCSRAKCKTWCNHMFLTTVYRQATQFVNKRPACHTMENDLMLARAGVDTWPHLASFFMRVHARSVWEHGFWSSRQLLLFEMCVHPNCIVFVLAWLSQGIHDETCGWQFLREASDAEFDQSAPRWQTLKQWELRCKEGPTAFLGASQT